MYSCIMGALPNVPNFFHMSQFFTNTQDPMNYPIPQEVRDMPDVEMIISHFELGRIQQIAETSGDLVRVPLTSTLSCLLTDVLVPISLV